jgi:amidase
MNDLCHLPAHELVSLMSTGIVSCREVVQAHLARIEAVSVRGVAATAVTSPTYLSRLPLTPVAAQDDLDRPLTA